MCALCRQYSLSMPVFPLLYQHDVAKHPEIIESKAYTQCFTVLADFDPEDPKGEKVAVPADPEDPKWGKAAVAAGRKVVSGVGDLDLLLSAGLSQGKKKEATLTALGGML